MSGLKVLPSPYGAPAQNNRFRLLLTNEQPQNHPDVDRAEKSATAAPLAYAASPNIQAYIQAQLIGSELNRSHPRHTPVRGPREAARAYGQARRRPETVAQMPVLQNVI